MSLKILEQRLLQYKIQSKQDELNAIKEILQEIALAALARTDFFKKAAFQEGTCLRILYGLPRFSEDLDFISLTNAPQFDWSVFLEKMVLEFEVYGLKLEFQDRSKADNTIKKAFLKEGSFGQCLNLVYPRDVSDPQKIQIKLEIDSNPPQGSTFDVKYLDFPYPFSLTLQDKSSLFAGKCHALLCREYTKGRDWFDFLWYTAQKTPINYTFLKNALYQTGPWKECNIPEIEAWVIEHLKEKIDSIDWEVAKKDVARFLRSPAVNDLKLWNTDFFRHYLGKLKGLKK